MLDFSTLKEITDNALDSMVRDSDDEKIYSRKKRNIFRLSFWILPLILGTTTWFMEITLTSLESYIGASIAIFTGLFFSLLLSIGGKIRAEKNSKNVDLDSFDQYRKSMKQIANITLYIIILGIVIFLIMLFNSIFKMQNYPIIEKLFTIGAVTLLIQYTVSLFFMMQRFFYVVRDELNNIDE